MTCVDHTRRFPSRSEDLVPSLGARQLPRYHTTDCSDCGVLNANGQATGPPHPGKRVAKAVRYRIRVRGQVPKDLPSKLAAIQAAAILRSRKPGTKEPS